MTRIISGEFGGRRLVTPADRRVRPTSDRVREAWFSILGPRIVDAIVVDLFAGSGALGLEAISRGARHATLVDLNRPSLDAIYANVEALGVVSRVRVVRGDVFRFLAGTSGRAFSIALADPPYGLGMAARVIEQFHAAPFADLLAVEHRADEAIPEGNTREYGDTAVTFYEAT